MGEDGPMVVVMEFAWPKIFQPEAYTSSKLCQLIYPPHTILSYLAFNPILKCISILYNPPAYHIHMIHLGMQMEGWDVRDGHHLLLSPSSIFRPITSDGQPPLTSCLLVCRRHSCSTYTTLQQLQDCSTGICCFCRFYTPQ